MTERSLLPTGIEVLDRKLDGGIPAGTMVLLAASPGSQSELFLYEMASVRPTTYLTTERPASEIRRCLQRMDVGVDSIDIYRVGPADPLGDAREAIQDLDDGSTLMVDPVRSLERTDRDSYREFLNEVKSLTASTASLTILNGLEGRDVPDQRDRTEYLADSIFSLRTTVRGGTIKNSLAIPKFRGGSALPEAIELDLTDDVTIDVTRKIA